MDFFCNTNLDISNDILSLIIYTAIWGILDTALTNAIFKPLAEIAFPLESLKIPEKNNLSVDKPASIVILEQVDALHLARRKLQRSMWKAFVYSSLFVTGVIVLYQEEWGFDHTSYFDDWPRPVPSQIRSFYMMQMGHYFYSTLVIRTEPKLSDMWQMIFHHVVSVVLLTSSYCVSYHRIGITLTVLTDISDPFLEAGKISNYLKYPKICDGFFALFAFFFLSTRTFIYPFAILIPAYQGTIVEDRPYGIYFNFWLILLQIMFWRWSYIIMNIVYKVVSGKGATDTREEE